jgi:pimeloyl-ACP methyl ester carboxylesterase
VNAVVDNLLINYELKGKGKLLLLVHGWGDSSKGLRSLSDRLSKEYKVLSVDLPGFGDSEPPKEPWNLDNYSKFLNDLLKKLQLGEPYAAAGHSNGGAVLIRAISLNLLEPKKLILIAASGVRTGKKVQRYATLVVAKTGNAATFWMPEHKRMALRKRLYGVAGSDMLVVPELQETFKRSVRQDVQKDAENISVPSLLIYARNDRAVPLYIGERFRSKIKGSRLELVEDAGHFVHLDQEDIVVKLIEEFVK